MSTTSVRRAPARAKKIPSEIRTKAPATASPGIDLDEDTRRLLRFAGAPADPASLGDFVFGLLGARPIAIDGLGVSMMFPMRGSWRIAFDAGLSPAAARHSVAGHLADWVASGGPAVPA